MIVSTQLTPHVSRWTRPAYVMAAGLVIAAAGCVLVCVGGLSESLFTVLGGFTLACVGIAPPTVLGTELVVGSAPPERAASASSVSATSNGFVIALGVATLGSVGTAVYRARLEIPGSVSPELAAVARAVPMITNLAD